MAQRRMSGRILPVPGLLLLLPLLVITLSCSDLGSWDRLQGNLLLQELEKDYQTRIPLSIDGGELSAPLLDFPVLVVLDNVRTAGYASLDPGHIYFVYVDELNTAFALDYEIERWGPDQLPAEELSSIWVRIPEVAPGKLTTFWLYYNTVRSGEPQNPAGVWRGGYELVYHFADEGAAADSASGRTGFIHSDGPVPSPWPAGVIGKGFRLEDAAHTWIDTGYKANLNAWTLEAWVRGDSPPGPAVAPDVFTGPIIGGERYNMVWDHNDAGYRGVLFNLQDKKDIVASFGSPLSGGSFYYLAGTYTVGGKDDRVTTYTDGAFQDQVLVKKPSLDLVTAPIRLGSSDGRLQVLNGIVDEVRISSVTRSADYIHYQHLSMLDGLLIYGAPEPI